MIDFSFRSHYIAILGFIIVRIANNSKLFFKKKGGIQQKIYILSIKLRYLRRVFHYRKK